MYSELNKLCSCTLKTEAHRVAMMVTIKKYHFIKKIPPIDDFEKYYHLMLLKWWSGTKICQTKNDYTTVYRISQNINKQLIIWNCPECRCSEYTLHWRDNEHDGVSNHQPHGCLLNRLFRRRSQKTSKLRVTGLCVGNSPGPVNSPHKGPVTRKMFPFDDVIMTSSKPHWNLPKPEIIMCPHMGIPTYQIWRLW